jgi:hypothetical protein
LCWGNNRRRVSNLLNKLHTSRSLLEVV